MNWCAVVSRTVTFPDRRSPDKTFPGQTIPGQDISRTDDFRTRQFFSARRNDHITPLLRDLHWLRVRERVKFRLCVLVYRCLHGMAPSYLADDLQLTSTVGTRRHLRSADSPTLVVRSTRRSTLGDRAFPVAAARLKARFKDRK